MDLIWIAVIAGSIIGLTVSVLFGIYNKPTADVYIKTLFNISSSDLILDGILFIVVVGFTILATISVIIRDSWYPVNRPWYFTTETLLMAFMSSAVFLVMPVFRGYSYTGETVLEFMLLVLKFGALHILLQFSGFYSSLFPPLSSGGKRNN